jgi:hypothetical protein
MVCFGVVFGVAARSGVWERNDVNHFWREALAWGIRKTNWKRRAKGRVGGEARWSGEDGCGGEVWRQLRVSSSRNFINFKKQERCRET